VRIPDRGRPGGEQPEASFSVHQATIQHLIAVSVAMLAGWPMEPFETKL
jgi:hypothetical protein